MKKKKGYSIERHKAKWAYIFLAVPLIFYLGIRYYPTINAFRISFTEWNIVSADKKFIGFENFIRLFQDPIFYKTLGNTFEYLLYGLPIGLLLSFTLAYNINKVGKLEGLFKAVYFIPYITSLVAVSWVWRWLYQKAPIGVINSILIKLGLPQQGFLNDPNQALEAILAPTIWAYIGFQLVIFLAGIKGIPFQYYESAKIDGANNRQLLRYITLPLLKPTLVLLVVVGSIFYLRIFTQVYNMTYQGEGGPLNSTKPLVLYIYNTAFNRFEMGYASAMTMVLFFIILIISLIELKVVKSND